MTAHTKKIQVDPSLYGTSAYNKKARFISYWHQINEISKVRPGLCLEIGVGSRFVASYLKNSGINVKTIDIDRQLCPDVAGDITRLPFVDCAFDLVACYEVLEHMPYTHFSKSVSEIARITRKFAIISLPDAEPAYRFLVTLPILGEISKMLTVPRMRKPVHEFDGQHYWEIGKHGYPLRKIVADIESAGLRMESTYRIFENPRHRFMVLKKL